MKQNAPPALFHVLFQRCSWGLWALYFGLVSKQAQTDNDRYSNICRIMCDLFGRRLFLIVFPLIICQCRLPTFVDRSFSVFSHISSLKENRLSTGFSVLGRKKSDICVFTQRLCNSSANVSAGTRRPQLRNEIEIVFKDILSCQEWDKEKWRPQLP